MEESALGKLRHRPTKPWVLLGMLLELVLCWKFHEYFIEIFIKIFFHIDYRRIFFSLSPRTSYWTLCFLLNFIPYFFYLLRRSKELDFWGKSLQVDSLENWSHSFVSSLNICRLDMDLGWSALFMNFWITEKISIWNNVICTQCEWID